MDAHTLADVPVLAHMAVPAWKASACIGRFAVVDVVMLAARVMHLCRERLGESMLVWATDGCAVHCDRADSFTARSVTRHHPHWIVGVYTLHFSATPLYSQTIVADLQARCAELLTAKESRCFSEI